MKYFRNEREGILLSKKEDLIIDMFSRLSYSFERIKFWFSVNNEDEIFLFSGWSSRIRSSLAYSVEIFYRAR